MPGAIDAIIHFIPVIFIVVLVHELGHFIAAKAMGIRVERFSIGFPPKLIGKTFGETEYCISAIPLGGYVKMSGMIDESLDGEKSITGAPFEFQSKSTPAKILVICAGVIMNFILAFVIYTGVTAIRGVGDTGGPIVGELQPDFPAMEAGLQAGDEIVEVEGQSVATWGDLVDVIHARPEMATQLVVQRGEETLNFEVTPQKGKIPLEGDFVEVGLIGIAPQLFFRPASFGEAISSGYATTIYYMKYAVTSIRLLVTGQASIKDLSGPVGIAKMSAQSAKGGILSLLGFIAFISINIGFLNILPIPALDGGHLIMVLWEAVARRPISNRVKLAIQQVGMVFILLLMAFIIFNDFTK
jgi:regulator of sigma E protease